MFVKTSSRILLSIAGVCLLCAMKTEVQRTGLTCSGFNGTTAEAALAYLQQDRATLEPECIYRAIGILRGDQCKPSADVLFRYLDFETPVPPGVPHQANASSPTGGIFPAVDLLCSFGESVVPRVKQAIRDDGQTTLSRLNAAKIYFALDNGPTSIGFIAKAAHDATQPAAAKELLHFAEIAVGYCAADKKEQCKQALKQ